MAKVKLLLRAVEVKFGKLGATWRHQLNGQALIPGVVVSSSVGRALAMKAGDPGSSPGSAKNFSGRGYWHTLVIQLLGGPEV